METENGETIWLADSSLISSVVVMGSAPTTVSRKRFRLILDVKNVPSEQSATLYISYLTRQVSWIPQYRALLTDEKKLEIEQSAIIINDWRDFFEASTSLYSGFPQIMLNNSISPMAPGVDLNTFLSSIIVRNGRQVSDSAFATQMVINNVSSYPASSASLPELETENAGESGVDVFAQNVGSRSLKKGERTFLIIDRKQTPYRRFIRWDVANTREMNGRVEVANLNSGSYGMTSSGSISMDSKFTEPWDVVAFRNPFSFPLTTGTASIYAPDRFLAQNSLGWCNPGEETLLPITKALGVRVKSTEVERDFSKEQSLSASPEVIRNLNKLLDRTVRVERWGQVVSLHGDLYRVAVIDATLELTNLRNEETAVEICRQFRGVEIQDSFEGFEKKPEIVLLNERIANNNHNAFNSLAEMGLTVVLNPKERKELKFSYQVLIAL